MKQMFNPPFLGEMKSAWPAGLILHWQLALFISLIFSVVFLLYVSVGEDPSEMTTSFIVDGFQAISPVLEQTVGYWLLLSYLQSAATPPSYTFADGNTIGHLAIHILSSLIVTTGLLLACTVPTSLSTDICPQANPNPGTLQHSPPEECPVHLAVGWTPSTCPPLMYEQ